MEGKGRELYLNDNKIRGGGGGELGKMEQSSPAGRLILERNPEVVACLGGRRSGPCRS